MNDTKKILILGAGKVAAPIVKYFLSRKYSITVATELTYQGELIIENNPLGEAVQWHSDDITKLNSLVRNHDVVVSLLPYSFHILVCQACITHKRSLVTTSYEQPGMKELHSDACKSNITILNEVGLDPGIDHMWASQMIRSIKHKGGKINKFISVCGALPSPESLDNPFRYKFSWSPMGVMKASTSKASYIRNTKLIEHDARDLMKNTFNLKLKNIGKLEAYANRDSLKYIELYQTPEVVTFFRGTLRYKGWCEIIDTLMEGGYLSEESFPEHITTYAELTSFLSNITTIHNIRDDFASKLKLKTHSKAIMAMEWVGLFSQEHFNSKARNPLTVLTNRMVNKIKMLPSDKDMVILNHQLLYTLPNGQQKMMTGLLTMMGKDYEKTAIADSVSYPAALAAELLLHNKITQKGVIRPVQPEIYEPILKKLRENFKFDFIETELEAKHWPEGW